MSENPRRTPWNKGKLTGAKPPLRPKYVWSFRTRLLVDGRGRDLAMFNLAIDSKPRGCDLVALKVEDVAPNGYGADRATVRQRKTGRPARSAQFSFFLGLSREPKGAESRRLCENGKPLSLVISHSQLRVPSPCLSCSRLRRPYLVLVTVWHCRPSHNIGHKRDSAFGQPAARPMHSE